MNRKILIFLLAGVLLGVAGGKWYSSSKGNSKGIVEISTDSLNNVKTSINETKRDTKIPSKVYEILKYVETFHEPKQGYLGGRIFHNYEKLLPENRPNGNSINYKEWDVNPKNGMKRGKERLITGDDKSAWYTDTHYKSFIKIH